MSAPRLRLYHYWRSSCSWRTRWAFELKGLKLDEITHVDILKGETRSPEHFARNPMGALPVLEFLDQPAASPLRFLTESMAIIEWLDETQPGYKILPADPLLRARARQLAETVNSGSQPVQNHSVALRHSDDPEERKRWGQHWITRGLSSYEKLCAPIAGRFSIGDSLTLADLFLIPQCYNAIRYEVALPDSLRRIYEAARATPECQAAEPEKWEPRGK